MTTSPSNPIRPDRSLRRTLFVWGTILVLSGTGIGAGGALWLKKPPAPPPTGGPGNPGPEIPNYDPKPIVSHMTRELNLTPDQEQQVTAAYAESLAAIKTLRSDMIVKLTAEHDKLRAAMKKTLTDVQYAQWDQHFEAMRSRMMPDAPPPRGFGHPHPGDDMGGPGPRGPMPGMMGHRGPPGSDEGDPEHRGPRDGRPGGPGDAGGPGFDPEHRGPRFQDGPGGAPPQGADGSPGRPEPQDGPPARTPATQPTQQPFAPQ